MELWCTIQAAALDQRWRLQVHQQVKALKLPGSDGHALASMPLQRAFTNARALHFTTVTDPAGLQGIAAALQAAPSNMRMLDHVAVEVSKASEHTVAW